MTDKGSFRVGRGGPILAGIVALVALTGCLADTPDAGGTVTGDLVANVLPDEEQIFGGQETYIDENGEEQVVYWDGIRTISPVEVRARDGRALDPVADADAARAAATAACQARGVAGLTEDARTVTIMDESDAVTALRFEGCALPEGGA